MLPLLASLAFGYVPASPLLAPVSPLLGSQPRRAAHACMATSGPPDTPFASAYKRAELLALWKALKKCYGGEEAARKAVAQNPQIMAPVYATPALVTQSAAALVKLLGKEEGDPPRVRRCQLHITSCAERCVARSLTRHLSFER